MSKTIFFKISYSVHNLIFAPLSAVHKPQTQNATLQAQNPFSKQITIFWYNLDIVDSVKQSKTVLNVE